jgi:hypothetical protein
MKIASLAALTVFALAACQSRPGADESGTADVADTTITTDQTLDTTIVTQDTTVETDTVTREGDTTVGQDTLQQ